MKFFSKLLSKIQNNKNRVKKIVSIVSVAVGVRYGKINSIPTSLSSNSTQHVERLHSCAEEDIQVIKKDGRVIKTSSGVLFIPRKDFQNEIPDYLKEAIQLRSGDLDLGKWKFGPGSRAKSDAVRNFKAKPSSSSIIPGADGFVPQTTYCRYHENAPLSCNPKVKVSDSPFQDNGGDNQPPPESSQFDASNYKGGPSPFEEYEYKDPAVVAQNIGFNQPNRLNKSYDKHAEDCFGIVENRNNENLGIFKGDITNLAQSADEVYKGSYRYQDPAYIFLKEINEKMTAVIVNATDGEYITTINPTSGQMEDLQSNGNIGLDTRPSMQLTLRLRGPKNSNL